MSDPLDPDFPQLREEFLAYVHATHEAHGFERDPRKLCEVLGIILVRSTVNLYDRKSGVPRILYDSRQPAAQLRFTLWHEFAHHLFQTADEGFQALLEERYGRDTKASREMEEQLCYEAAGLLLMPRAHLTDALGQYGFDPRGALHLTQACGASHAAALRRLVDAYDVDAWCLLMQRGGLVLYSHTRTRYAIGSEFVIDEGHPLHQTFEGEGLYECRARLPFRNRSSRTPHRPMRAVREGERVLAIFAVAFPPRNDGEQPGLFPPNMLV